MIQTLLICATFAFSDGDSGRCTTPAGEVHRVRLQGVDAGEVSPFTRCRQHPMIWACSEVARRWGPVAADRARGLAADGALCEVVDTDRWRRTVARCSVSGRDIAATLVREGLAVSEAAYGDPYRAEEQAAWVEDLGIWEGPP